MCEECAKGLMGVGEVDALAGLEDEIGVGRMLRWCKRHSNVLILIMKSMYFWRIPLETRLARMSSGAESVEKARV